MSTAIATSSYSPDQVGLLKRTVCKGATDDEFALFIGQCQRTGLDPFARQIHAVKRWDAQQQREVMSIQTGIDGYRLIAERTGLYAGNDDPVYDIEDAPHPNKATVTVWKLVNGQRVAFTRSARWSEFVQTKKGGEITRFWAKMPYLMLGKVAEALALRAAFPQELSGIYTHDEMQQAGEVDEVETAPVTRVTPEPVKELPPKSEQLSPSNPAPFIALMGRKGFVWSKVLAMLDEKHGTEYRANKAGFASVAPEHIAKFTAWLERQPDAQHGDEPPEADHATGDDDASPACIGRDLAQMILNDLNALGIDWGEVRDSCGNGMGLADIAGFQALLDVKVTDLTPDQGLRLNAELKRRLAGKRAGKAAATA